MAYLLLVPAVIVWAISLPVFLGLSGCAGANNAACLGADQLLTISGNQGAVIRVSAACYLVALVAAIAAQVLVGKLHFAIVWLLAVAALVLSVVGFGIITGAIGTPWGQFDEFYALASTIGGA